MLSLKNVYFLQAGIGILANALLLVFHVVTIHQVDRPRPSDITICHLAFVHIVMLFTAMDFLSRDMIKSPIFTNELQCKLLLYMSRVSRGLSISTTGLLSVIQVITISPNSFCLSRFKQKLKNHVVIAFFCFWSINLSFNSNRIIYTVAHSNRTNVLNVSKSCSLSSMNSTIMVLFVTLSLFQNIFFLGLMLLSSMYMVIFLCSHRKKSEYLCSMSTSSRISPAKRATRTVLVLVSFFVIMYCVDTIISSFLAVSWKYEPILLDINRLLGNVYATVSPLVLISSDKRITHFMQNVIDMTKVIMT